MAGSFLTGLAREYLRQQREKLTGMTDAERQVGEMQPQIAQAQLENLRSQPELARFRAQLAQQQAGSLDEYRRGQLESQAAGRDIRQQISENELALRKATMEGNQALQQQLLGIRERLADVAERRVDRPGPRDRISTLATEGPNKGKRVIQFRSRDTGELEAEYPSQPTAAEMGQQQGLKQSGSMFDEMESLVGALQKVGPVTSPIQYNNLIQRYQGAAGLVATTLKRASGDTRLSDLDMKTARQFVSVDPFTMWQRPDIALQTIAAARDLARKMQGLDDAGAGGGEGQAGGQVSPGAASLLNEWRKRQQGVR